eukprot:scaffold146748_cov32-Tisochrysis_lutea.AAC.4
MKETARWGSPVTLGQPIPHKRREKAERPFLVQLQPPPRFPPPVGPTSAIALRDHLIRVSRRFQGAIDATAAAATASSASKIWPLSDGAFVAASDEPVSNFGSAGAAKARCAATRRLVEPKYRE